MGMVMGTVASVLRTGRRVEGCLGAYNCVVQLQARR